MSFMLGAKALKRLAMDNDALAFFQAKFNTAVFKGEEEIAVYEFVKDHFTQFSKLPSPETLDAKFPALKELLVPEPSSYYVKQVEERFGYDLLNKSTADARDIIKKDPHDVEKAWAVMQKARGNWLQQKHRASILDVPKELADLVLTTYTGTLTGDVIPAFFGWPYLDEMGGVLPTEVVSFVGRPATGKAQPLDANILTTSGWKRMGDIRVGDSLASVDGEESIVEGVYPQGEKEVFKLTFSDGRSTEASGDHLWEVFYRDWEVPQVLTTLQLIAKLEHKRYQKRLSIRLFSGQFGSKHDLPLHPYLLGALIGDGCFRAAGVKFSSIDQHVITKMDDLVRPFGFYWKQLEGCDWLLVSSQGYDRQNPVRDALMAMNLWDKKSEHKFIPGEYLSASLDQRWELLRGLMDTDGTSEYSGGISYSTSSRILAEDVAYLVRSLGGKATVSVKATAKLDNYIVHIVLRNRSDAFSLPRKKVRVEAQRTTHTNHRLTLHNIEPVGMKECQCIQVSHPSHLYITDGFVVTHNTYQMLYVALHNWRERHENVLFVSMEMSDIAIGQRIAAMYTGTPVGQLKVGQFSTQTFDYFLEQIEGIKKEVAKFYVVDGNLATSVDEIYDLAEILGCTRVFIDGAYLMPSESPRDTSTEKVRKNIEYVKRRTRQGQMVTFCSWQFNRKAADKFKEPKKHGKVGVEDIGLSDAIGQISAVVIGTMQEESVETLIKRDFELLKGRDGQVGRFSTKWDFMKMDFRQIDEEIQKEMPMQGDELQYV